MSLVANVKYENKFQEAKYDKSHSSKNGFSFGESYLLKSLASTTGQIWEDVNLFSDLAFQQAPSLQKE